MPWELEIHTIDVGPGESSLIVARNAALQATRSILIDGGRGAYAEIVNHKVQEVLNGQDLNVILVTHYDGDHSSGVANLLLADNLSILCREIAAIAAPYATTLLPMNGGGPQQVAAKVACAAYGAMIASWGINALLIQPLANGQPAQPAQTQYAAAADAGVVAVDAAIAQHAWPPAGEPTLITSAVPRRNAARFAGVAAATAYANQQPIQPAVENALFSILLGGVPDTARFPTNGIYSQARIIDIGAAGQPLEIYIRAVSGRIDYSAPNRPVPGLARVRTGAPPDLGTELFWNGQAPPAEQPAPNGAAPFAVVVSAPNANDQAADGQVWQSGQGAQVQAQQFLAGDRTNSLSIGLLIRFNDFQFFTAGDLPQQGENLLVNPLLQQQPLPDGANGFQPGPPPGLLRAFKCGHHGSNTSTSPALLQLQPAIALISCGASHGHPQQPVINRLQGQQGQPSPVALFFLTNCRYNRAHIPASPANNNGAPPAVGGGVVQDIAGNKSRIAGDNATNNMAAGRVRGDIELTITQAGSIAPLNQHTCFISYFENYPAFVGLPGNAVPGPVVIQSIW